MSAAQYAYDETRVGAEGRMAASGDHPAFQIQVRRLEDMENEGLVRIERRHSESQTGHRYVDLVTFTRLK